LYATIVYKLFDDDPVTLISCIDSNTSWYAWTCKQVLRYKPLNDAAVRTLNGHAGAQYAVMMENQKEADDVLAALLAHGVDINAVNSQANGWTALHLAIGDQPEKVALLLKYGARTDLQDQDGRTPLELARFAAQKRPDNPHLLENVRQLEAASR